VTTDAALIADCAIYPDSCVSFGGGVNSVAMTILLVNKGWHGPIVFSDTQTEHPETYCYMDMFERDWLNPRGLEITRLSGMPWQRYKGGVSLIEYCEVAKVIPLAAVRWCTAEWKGKPLDRWQEEHGGLTALIGIAADESHRMPRRCRPLCDWWVTRVGCIKAIEAEGLSIPRKSGCYICPFQRVSRWRDLWEHHPEIFERAARLEEIVSEGRKSKWVTLDPSGRWTLRDLERRFETQDTLFDDADWEGLLRYKPCMCGL